LKKNLNQVRATGIFPPKKVVRHEDQTGSLDKKPTKTGLSKLFDSTKLFKKEEVKEEAEVDENFNMLTLERSSSSDSEKAKNKPKSQSKKRV
jgi:hypothetical protein